MIRTISKQCIKFCFDETEDIEAENSSEKDKDKDFVEYHFDNSWKSVIIVMLNVIYF